MTIAVRRAEIGDEETIVRFNAALAKKTEQITLDEGTLRRGVRAVLADPGKGFYTVAEMNGEIVGQLLITLEWSDWRNGWFWWLQSVYVRVDARRMGVFRTLFEAVKRQAVNDESVIGLRLYVETGNEAAQRTYTEMGLDAEPYRLHGLYPLPGRTKAY